MHSSDDECIRLSRAEFMQSSRETSSSISVYVRQMGRLVHVKRYLENGNFSGMNRGALHTKLV